MRYPIEFTHEEGSVTVCAPDIPSAHTFGDDKASARRHLPDAIDTALSIIIADRKEIPAPSPARGRETIALSALSTAKIELYQAMREAGIRKATLARRLGWKPPQVDRLLDLCHASRLDQIERAFAALGKAIEIKVREAA